MLATSAALQANEHPAFRSLDTDANGHISIQQVQANPAPIARWGELDVDRNERRDRSELSAIEVGNGGMEQAGEPAAAPAR